MGVLHVGVHGCDQLARGVREPRIQRGLFPKIAGEGCPAHGEMRGESLRLALHGPQGAVGRPVIDEDDLKGEVVGLAHLLRNAFKFAQEEGEAFLLVVTRDDD